MKQKKSLTLLELLIVIVILASLVSLAIPYYRHTTGRALAQKAVFAMALLTQAEKIVQIENGAYVVSPGAAATHNACIGDDAGVLCVTPAAEKSGINLLSIDNDADWAYAVSLTPNIVTATLRNAIGACAGGETFTYNMDTGLTTAEPACLP